MSPRNKTLLIVVAALILVGVILLVWNAQKGGEGAGSAAEGLDGLNSALDSAAGGVEVPSANPYDDVPSLNPVEQTNPFRELKTNPFAP